MIQKLKKSNAGFTLVELIVVIAILGVLAAVLVPQYIQYVDKSRVAADDAAVAEIGHALQVVTASNEAYVDNTYSVTISKTDNLVIKQGTTALADTDAFYKEFVAIVPASTRLKGSASPSTKTVTITKGALS